MCQTACNSDQRSASRLGHGSVASREFGAKKTRWHSEDKQAANHKCLISRHSRRQRERAQALRSSGDCMSANAAEPLFAVRVGLNQLEKIIALLVKALDRLAFVEAVNAVAVGVGESTRDAIGGNSCRVEV